MKKQKILIFSLILMLAFVANIISVPLSVLGQASDILSVTIVCTPETVTEGEKINFNLEYDILKSQDIEGKTLTFNLTENFKDINPSVPPQHFSSKVVDNGLVTAVFGAVDTAIRGYVRVEATVKAVSSIQSVTVEARLDGKVLATSTITIKPKEQVDPDGNNTPVERLLLKSVEDAYDYTVARPVEGKVVNYTLYINESYSELYGMDFRDNMPEGMELIPNSVVVTEEPKDGYATILESNFNGGYYVADTNSLYIVFNGSTNSMYRVNYKVRITGDKSQYINIAEIYRQGQKIGTSSTTVTVKDDPTMVKKSADNSIVSNKGDEVNYTLEINPNNKAVSSCEITDKLPIGMEFVDDSIEVKEIDLERNERNVTSEFLSGNRISISNGVINIKINNTNNKYIVNYKLKVTEIKREYNNTVTMNFADGSATDNAIVNYETNSGAINAEKLVDKKVIDINQKDENLVYTIKFQCFGFFESGKIKVVDALDSRLKNITTEIPPVFEVTVDGNTLSFENSKGPINYGDDYEIKIFADASDVPWGSTIENVAKINKANTRPVYTKKGYKFVAKKVDSITGEALQGASFELLDAEQKVIDVVKSDANGIIERHLDAAGKYYLREVQAPSNYEKNPSPIEFEITESNLGTVLNLGNLINNKIVEQPKPPVVEEPKPPVVEEPKPPVVEEPKPPVEEEPKPPVVEEPKPPVVEEPKPPVVEEPKPPVEEEPKPPAVEEPKPPVEEEPKPPVVEEPKPPVVEEPKPPVEDPKPPVEEEPKPPVEEPKPPVEEETKPPVVEEPKPPAVDELKPPVVEEPKPPVEEEPKPPVVEEPKPPVEEPKPPVVEEPKPPVEEEPKPPAVDELKPPVVEEPKPPVEEEPKPPVVEEPVIDEGKVNSVPKTGDEDYFAYFVLLCVSGLGLFINRKTKLK